MAIHTSDQRKLEKANSEAIEQAFDLLLDNFNNSSFLGEKNYLKNSTIKVLEKQFKKKPKERKKFLAKYTVEYVAASALQHNLDSWTYYGHAINSLLRGDDLTARHLLYYSELRAAMSFLATQGVGIFNDRHVFVNRKRQAKIVNEKIPGTPPNGRTIANTIGTHVFAWDAFNHFISRDENLEKIFDNYTIEGVSINTWLEKFAIPRSMRISIARDFLKRMSFDLDHFSKDRDARNEVSYRPSCMTDVPAYDLKNNLIDIEKIWNFAKPDNKKGEIKSDFVLLTEIFQLAFKKSHPNNLSFNRARKQYNNKLKIMLDDLGIPERRKEDLISILNTDQRDLYKALSLTDISSPFFKKGMLYRGFMFMRLANVFCNKLIRSANDIDKESLQFWWKPLGLHFGLWEDMGEPDDFADLWQDVEDYQETLEGIIEVEQNKTTRAFWRENADLGFILTTCQRVGFWGLGL